MVERLQDLCVHHAAEIHERAGDTGHGEDPEAPDVAGRHGLEAMEDDPLVPAADPADRGYL